MLGLPKHVTKATIKTYLNFLKMVPHPVGWDFPTKLLRHKAGHAKKK